MKKTEMQLIAESVLEEMARTGKGENLLRKYRKNGFDELLRYFRQHGESEYSDDLIDDFVNLTRHKYEQGDISRWAWGMVFSSAGQLKHFRRYGC